MNKGFKSFLTHTFFAIIITAASVACRAEEPWRPVINNGPLQHKELGRTGPARLESVSTPQGEFFIIYLHGTHEQMGAQYGELLGKRLIDAKNMFKRLAAKLDDVDESELQFLINQGWNIMRPNIPDKYKQEIAAISAAAAKAGETEAESVLRAALLISNLSDGYDIKKLIGLANSSRIRLLDREDSCSFFAVWGKRTKDGRMYASRDLDWNHDTGLSAMRLIAIYDPVDEKGRKLKAYATFGYMGFIGALAGMNDHGIAVAEVGSTNTVETLRGMPWTLRFREVLETSSSKDDALKVIKTYKNTIGYNFMVADGDADNFGKKSWKPSAAAIETNAKHTVIYKDDDPKEKNAVAVGKDGKPLLKDGKPVKYGFTMPYAIYRADTSMSSDIRCTQSADNGPGDPDNDGFPQGNSYRQRYKFQYDIFKAFETGAGLRSPQGNLLVLNPGKPTKVGFDEAALAAATAAAADGNILSVIYSPSDLDFWIAYESGTGDTWKPAPQSGYVKFNLGKLIKRYRGK